MQESPVKVSNRFQVLAPNEDVLIQKHVHAEHSNLSEPQLEGNKNKTVV